MLIRYEVAEKIATLTLDSPGNRNALSAGLTSELLSGLERAASDDVRAVVLTHTGGTFCAGADLAHPADPAAMVEALRAILELPKPVVGWVDGHVRAGGMGLVAACDLVVAGPGSSFGLTEARLGLAPAVISPVLLARLQARAASRYFLTGETFDGPTAAAIGLVTLATECPGGALAKLLDALRTASPQGLAETKALTTAAVLAEFDRSAAALAEQSARLFASPEAREGMLAFLEKRQPEWAR
jgi:enoyl-CoA hydratase